MKKVDVHNCRGQSPNTDDGEARRASGDALEQAQQDASRERNRLGDIKPDVCSAFSFPARKNKREVILRTRKANHSRMLKAMLNGSA